MITDVARHLREQAEVFRGRAETPVVAWDCIAAEMWAGICDRLADEVAGLDRDAALGRLREVRASAPDPLQGGGGGAGVIARIDFIKRMDELIDPVAFEPVGRIELGEDRARGGCLYKRFRTKTDALEVCRRRPEESDAAWRARRNDWLSRYHPDVPVCTEWTPCQAESVLGSLRDLAGSDFAALDRAEAEAVVRA